MILVPQHIKNERDSTHCCVVVDVAFVAVISDHLCQNRFRRVALFVLLSLSRSLGG
jgi:hypothetical protein